MGTNYYLHTAEPCPTCGHEPEPRHIGKSSGGWCFALRVYPEDGIHDLDDWRPLFTQGRIKDEYDSPVSADEMMAIITERGSATRPGWSQASYAENHAEPGPNNLARCRIKHGCIGHGAGTWDLIEGEFS